MVGEMISEAADAVVVVVAVVLIVKGTDAAEVVSAVVALIPKKQCLRKSDYAKKLVLLGNKLWPATFCSHINLKIKAQRYLLLCERHESSLPQR